MGRHFGSRGYLITCKQGVLWYDIHWARETRGNFANREKTALEKSLVEFRQYLIYLERSQNTIDSYLAAVRVFYKRYDEITKENMIKFKQWLIEEYKPRTAALRCVAMNVFCDFAGKSDCKVKGVKMQRNATVENVISLGEYKRFLRGLAGDEQWKVYYMIKFLAGTGCRASELAKLKKSCLGSGVFTLWTKGKIRTIIIPKQLIEESKEYFDTVDSEYLFPNRNGEQITSRGIASQIKKYGRRYNIRDEVLHPHAFRHLFAILFLKQNKNIALLSDVLGHESLNTTAIYLRLSAEEQKRQIDQTVKW